MPRTRSLAQSLLSLCAPLAVWCAPSSAQPNAVRVLYSREMPRAVRAKMPGGWKSRFFGACKLPGREGEVLFHLSSKREVEPGEVDERGTRLKPLPCALDVFTRVKSGRRQVLQLLNTMRFGYEGYYDFGQVRADVMWADPRTRRIPILKLTARDNFAERRSFGQDVLVSFPQGLKAQANVQFLGSSGQRDYVQRNSFDKVDARGLAVVTSVYETSESRREIDWLWNGEDFGPPKPPA